MNTPRPNFPTLTTAERTPAVEKLLELLAWQSKRIAELEQEILKLKKETTKPNIQPSKMDKPKEPQDEQKSRPGKKVKTNRQARNIDETITIQPKNIPVNSRFKGYRQVVVQDLIIKAHTICYRLAEYQTSDGQYVIGQLPETLKGSHFGKQLTAFILYQYHHQHVTQPLLLQQLRDLGIEISSGSLNNLITENLEIFHQEKDALLAAGMKVSKYVQTDDTSARHDGKNGYCTYIGNDLFSWFASTESKSRINFLILIKQGLKADYVFNSGALEYMARQNLSKKLLTRIEPLRISFNEYSDLENWFNTERITNALHRRIITEGTLIGGILAQGIPADFGIVSDDAGQFNVFDHALCWIHAERAVNRLLPSNKLQKQAIAQVREQVWSIYHQIKEYKLKPERVLAEKIREDFTRMIATETCYDTLNQVLKQFGKNRNELLRVLDKPYLPVHNNLSERDIREYVKKRKISSSTRSEIGRRCRDTFTSLKKTCRKQGISFWAYLKARLLDDPNFPSLSDLLYRAAAG